VHDAASLGVALRSTDAARLLQLLDELERWNRAYNLTAITQREEMVTHHLLDSLASTAICTVARSPTWVPARDFPGSRLRS